MRILAQGLYQNFLKLGTRRIIDLLPTLLHFFVLMQAVMLNSKVVVILFDAETLPNAILKKERLDLVLF